MTQTQQLITDHFATLQPQFDVSLAPLTYFKIGGPAEVLIVVKSRADLIAVVQFCRQEHVPLTMLGGASNVIIDDAGISGVVVRVENAEYEVLPEKLADGRTVVRVGVGYKTALFVRQTIEDGLKGLEYFLGVPGVLGGSIF